MVDGSTQATRPPHAARTPLRLLHCSDLHLDHMEESSALPMLRALRLFTAEAQAAAVLIAGDIFDRANQRETFVFQVAEELAAIDVPIIAIPGNHDICYDPRAIDAPTLLNVLLGDRMTLLTSPDGESITELHGALTVWGRGMLEHSLMNDPLYGLTAVDPQAQTWQIALAHGELIGVGSSPIDLPKHTSALEHFDYLALGHHHVPLVTRFGDTVVAYSGSASRTQGRSEVALVDLTAEGVSVETHRLSRT